MKKSTLLALVFISSCTNLNTSVRTEYFLNKVGPFVVSNSQTNPYQLKKIKNGIQIEYSVLAKNVSSEEQIVDLKTSTYKVNGEEGKLKCFINADESKESISIPSQKQFRIDCIQELFSNQKNGLLTKDSTVFLNIVMNDEAELSLRYSTVIEDFE